MATAEIVNVREQLLLVLLSLVTVEHAETGLSVDVRVKVILCCVELTLVMTGVPMYSGVYL